MSTADKNRTSPGRLAGLFGLVQLLLRAFGWFSFIGATLDDKSVSDSKKPVSTPSNPHPHRSSPTGVYPFSKQVPNQPGIAMPERTKRFCTECGFHYELETSRGKKRNRLVDHLNFKGYWVAIACQQKPGGAVAFLFESK